MNKKSLLLVLLLSFAIIVLTACGGSANKSSQYVAREDYNSSYAQYDKPTYSTSEGMYGYTDNYYEEEYREEVDTESLLISDPTENTGNAKLIYRANMSLDTTEFEECSSKIQSLIQEYGGYVEYSDLNGSTYRYSNITARIPSEKYAAFVNASQGTGTLTYFSESVENITDHYYDTELRLQSAKNRLAQLEEMMKQAETMEDMITIQNAIVDAQYEIDSYSGTLRHYDNLVGFSTVTISIQEVSETKGIDPAPIGFGERLSRAFENGISNTKYFFQNLLLSFANHFVGWIFWIAIVAVGIFFLIKAIKKGKEKDLAHRKMVEQQRMQMAQHQMMQNQMAQQVPMNPALYPTQNEKKE